MASLNALAKRWLAGLFLLIAIVLLTALAAGMLLPERHELTRTLTLSRNPDAVWRAITDSVRLRSWRTGLIRLERIADSGGMERWRETSRDGSETIVTMLAAEPPVHLVTRRARAKSLFEWEYVIGRSPEGVTVAVTQRGWIPGRTERFASQFLSGHAAELERYLIRLADYFDEPARIR